MARKMKDSGIQWIGKIPEHWEMRKLKYILHERNEKNDPVKTNEILSLTAAQGVIPYAEKEGGGNKPKDDLTAYKLAYPNDVVMNSMNVLSGSVGLSKYFGCVSPVYYMLYSNDNDINIKYYNYIFKTKTFQRSLMGLGNGILIKESGNGNLNTIRMRIPLEKLNGLLFMVPSRNEQDKIVEFLDKRVIEIDNAINKTKETIEEYKKYKQSIITEIIIKGLSSGVEMKSTTIEWAKEIPAHWNVEKGKHILTLLERPILDDDDVITCFRDGEVTLRKNRREEGFTFSLKEIGYQGIEPNDLVVHGMDGFAGAIGISDSRGKASPVLNVLDTKQNKRYIMYYLRSLAYNEVFTALATGIRVRSCDLRWNKLAELLYVLPPLEEQEKIVDYIDEKCIEIDNLVAKKESLLMDLEDYKKSLIYEYVTGKKEVPEEKIFPFPAVVNCKNKRFAQAVLLTKVLDEFGDYHSGRVKVAKTLYVLENHIGFDFEVDSLRKVAGPLDKQYYDAEAIVRHNNWFNVFEDTSNVKFFAGKDKDRYLEYYDKYFKDHDSEIQRIIDVFKNLNMNEAELLATAYASWNDFIIKGDDFNKDDIVEDIFAWDDSKKRFSKETWLGALSELEAKGLSPLGHGKITVLEKE